MNRTHSMSTPRALTGRRAGTTLATFAMLGALGGCSSDDIIGNAKLPPHLIDPGAMHNAEGALAAYRSAADLLGQGLNVHVRATGFLSDELTSDRIGIGVGYSTPWQEYLDSRHAEIAVAGAGFRLPYSHLNKTRGQVRHALGMLREYAPSRSPALEGHLYAIDGYAKLMLAEGYCSGIPLSELEYGGDYRLAGPSTTEEVMERALASMDTAVASSADSARILDFARVGRGRVLLGLGRHAEAAAAVAAVPTGYVYAMPYPTVAKSNFFRQAGTEYTNLNLSDREGINGLPFRSANDPRTVPIQVKANQYGPIFRPARYNAEGTTPIPLASGIEARLIEAEAALAGGGGWLAILNALRTNGTFSTRPNAANPAVTDTLWNAGSGGVAGLAPLADPGTPAARVNLVFHERAFWLYLTGQRLGDLRRLVRQYGRDANAVFPFGAYQAALGSYGASVSMPVPDAEIQYNPRYDGCLSEDA